MRQYQRAIERLDAQLAQLRRHGWDAHAWELLGMRTRLLQEVAAEDGWITVRDAIRLTGCSARTIRRAIKRGQLPAVVPGGGRPGRVGYRLRKADVLAWFYAQPCARRATAP